jgi:hypothetical protein
MEDDALKRVAFAAVFFCALPALGAPTPAGGACVADAECVAETICEGGTCTPITGRRRIVPPFYFHKKGAYGYRDIVPVFYFHHWGRETDNLVQFPFFWRLKDKAHDASTTVVPLPVPLIWTQNGTKRTFAAPFLLAGGSTDEATGESWRVWFPFFFDHHTKDTRTTVTLLSWFKSSPGHSAGVIFPLFWHVKDTVQGYEHLVLVPLFDYESDARGRHERTVSPVGFYEHDDDAGLKQGLLLVPPIFYRRDRQRTVTVVPPLYTSWKVHGDGSSGFMVGPLFHSTDPEGSTSGLFPLYWRWYDKHTQATTNWIFPVAGFHSRPDARGGYVGPGYVWSSKNGWGAGLAPLLFVGRSGPKRHAVVFPLVWHFSDESKHTSTTAVGPAYYHKAEDGYDAGLAPALLLGRHGDKSYGVVPPIYWHFGQKNGTTTDVAGPVYVQRGPDGWRFGLAPLLFFGDKAGHSHQVIFPLFFRFADANNDRLLVGPFYHQRKGEERLDVFFPLLYLARGPRHGLLLTPLAGWSKTPAAETLVVGPYYQHKDHLKHSTTRFLFPLGAVHEAPDYKVTVQFPFFWRVREGDEADTVVFPIYWRVRSPRMAFDGVFPLFFRAKTPVATTTLFGPIWSRTRADGGRNLGLFPVFAYGSNQVEGKPARWFGMPGVFYRDNRRTESGELIAGLFYDAWRPGRWDAGLPPLVFAWKRNTARFLVTPIFYRQTDVDSSMSVLGPVYWGHNGTTKRFGLFPLFFARTGEKGTAAGVFPLIYVNARPHGSTGITPVFGWFKYETGWRFYLGPFYARRDQEYSSTALWPLVYFSKNHQTGAMTRMVLPLYFDGRTDDGRELQLFTPAIWRYHSVERTITVGLPAYFDIHSFGESRTTGFFPLFVRHRDWAGKSVSYTVPALLFWARHRYGGDDPGTDAVWFPLFWRYGGKDSTTVAAPLFWDFKRGESRTTIGIPVFAYWKRQDAKRLILLNMYYRRGINHEEGSWHCYVIPFVDFGRPRQQDLEWNVLMGLFGYARQGINRTLKLFWLWDIRLEPVRSQNLSWFGSTETSARTEF